MKNKKKVISIVLVAVMICSTIVGTIAYFTDRVKVSKEATIGELDITLDSNNLNLLNEDGLDLFNPTEARDLDYSITNEGNKSADIKQTVVISLYDEDGNPVDFTRNQPELLIYDSSSVELIAGEGWFPKDNNQPISEYLVDDNVIYFNLEPQILDGNHNIPEYEKDAVSDTYDSNYVLVFDPYADNEFADCIIKLDLIVEAKQHRNTDEYDGDWDKLQTYTYVLSNGNSMKVVEKIEAEDIRVIPGDNIPELTDWTYELTSNGITLTSYIGTETDVVVYNAYKVDGVVYNNVSLDASDSINGPFRSKADNITSITFRKGVNIPVNASYLFYNCANLRTVNMTQADFYNTTNISNMFNGCTNLTSVIIDGIKIPSVKDMSNLFKNCTSLSHISVNNIDVSNVSIMDGAFQGCTNLNTLDISKWDFSGLDTSNTGTNSDVYNMFKASGLTNVLVKDDLAYNYVYNEATYMSGLNSGCTVEIKEIQELTDWTYITNKNTNTVKLVSYIGSSNDVTVYNAYKVDGVVYNNVEMYPASQVSGPFRDKIYDMNSIVFEDGVIFPENAGYMFYSLFSLTSLDVSGVDTSKMANTEHMFDGCMALTSLNLDGWNMDKVKNASHMFAWCDKLTSLSMNGWDTSSFETTSYMFHWVPLTSIDLSSWTTDNLKDISYMFRYSKLENINTSGWNTSNIENMAGVFQGIPAASLSLSHWTTPKVTTMEEMFDGCWKLTSLDIKHFDVSNVENMNKLLSGCKLITTFDTTGWNTESLKSMKSAFSSCENLTSLDLNHWTIDNVESLVSVFAYCDNLTDLKVNNWNTSNVKVMENTFYDMANISVLDISGWDMSGCDLSKTGLSNSMVASMFSGSDSLTKVIVKDDTAKEFLTNDNYYAGLVDTAEVVVNN